MRLLLAIAVATLLGAALFGALLWWRSRGRLPRAENILLHGALALGLAGIAAGGTLWLLADRPPSRPLGLVLVSEALLRDSPGTVARSIAPLLKELELHLASFRQPGDPPAVLLADDTLGSGMPRREASFDSPEAGRAWAGVRGADRPGSRLVILSAEPLGVAAALPFPTAVGVFPEPARRYLRPLEPPPVIFRGRGLPLQVVYDAGPPPGSRILLYDDDRLVQSREAFLPEVALPATQPLDLLPAAGPHFYRLDLVDDRGKVLERHQARVRVVDPPIIRYVGGRGPTPLADLLGRAGFAVERLGGRQLASAPPPSAGTIVILDDVPASFLTWEVIGRLYRGVAENGAGLLSIGGPESYGPGLYGGAPIERLLPVWMGLRTPDQEKHTTALVTILDTSGSMLCPPEGCGSDAERMFGEPREERGPRVRKLELAQQALLNLLPAMKDADWFGLLGAREEPYWEWEPSILVDRPGLEQRIRSLTGKGGGINLYSSVLAGFQALEKIPAELKHLVVLLDTGDVDELTVMGVGTAEELVKTLTRRNISLSFIGVGFSDDRYVPILNGLATSTGGSLYLTSDLTEIPRFLAQDREQLSKKREIRRPMGTIIAGRELPGLTRAPGLEGQYITEAKPDGAVALFSELGYPLLAYRRVGRGAVASFTADSGADLAPAWLLPDSRPAWDAIVANLLPEDPGELSLYAAAEGGTAGVWVQGTEARPAGILAAGDGRKLPLLFRETAPRVYRAEFDVPPRGDHRLHLQEAGAASGNRVLRVRGMPTGGEARTPDLAALGPVSAPLEIPLGKSDLRFLLLLATGLLFVYELFRER